MYTLGLIGLSREKKVIELIKKIKLNFKIFTIFDSYEKNICISI